MHEIDLRVVARPDGQHEVQSRAGEVLAVCASNAQAWAWIDRHAAEGQSGTDRHYRIRGSAQFS